MLNKRAANEDAAFDVELDKTQSLDTNVINMTFNFWLTKFTEDVWKEDGWDCDEND